MTKSMAENFFKAWREHRDLTQVQAAELAGMSQPVLARIESGARKYDASHLAKLAIAYRCSEWELIGRHPAEDRSNVVDIWDRIPDKNRELARRALEAFTENKS